MELARKIRSRLALKKILKTTLIFLVVFSITGFLILPPIVKSVALKQLSERLKREVTIQAVKLNPFMLSLTIQGVVVKEPKSSDVFVSFDKLYLNFQTMSLFKQGVIVKEITLERPYVNIVRKEDLTYNFSDLLKEEKTQPAEPAKPFLFSLNNIQIIGGGIDFFDGPKHTRHIIKEAILTVPFISNLPYYLDTYVQPSFSAQVNDHLVSLKGTVKPFADSIETHFDINIKDFNIPYYLAYVPLKKNYTLVSAFFDAQVSVSFMQYTDKKPSISAKGAATLKQIRITDTMDAPLVSLPQVDMTISSSDLLGMKVHFGKIAIQSPEINVALDKTGKLNLMTLMPAGRAKPEEMGGGVGTVHDPAAEGKMPLPVIEADEVLLTSGKITFADVSEDRKFSTSLEDIQATVSHFSTIRDKKTEAVLSFVTDTQEAFRLTSSFSVVPLTAEGTAELKQLALKKYAPYYNRYVNFSVEDGRLDLQTQYQYRKAGDEPDIGISALRATLNSLRLKKGDEAEDFLRSPMISVNDLSANLTKKEVDIDDVSSRGGFILGKRYRIGTLLFGTLLKVSEQVSPVKDVPSTGMKKIAVEKPWAVTIKKLLLDKYTVKFDDRMLEDPVVFTMGNVRLKGEKISTVKNAKGRISLSMKVEDKGTAAADGTIMIEPVSVSLKLVTKNVPILPLQSYITERINVFVTEGIVSSDGSISFSQPKDGAPRFGYRGSFAINHFATVDKNNAEDFLKWKSLHLDGINVRSDPLNVSIDEVALTDFYSRIIVNADATLNLQNVVTTEQKAGTDVTSGEEKGKKNGGNDTGTTAEVKTGKGKEPVQKRITIETVTLQGGTVNFTDNYIKPNYTANLLEIGGRISGLSSEEDKMGSVDLRGKLDNYAPLEITGKINPLRDDLYVDLKVDFRDMDLSPVTPYSGRYVGYAIEKGKLSLGLQYLIVKKKLDAQNRVFLDQLTLGDKVDSPDATKLPVKLAIALLKNRKGEIELNLPVSGQLDDPKFRLGSVIIKILVNILVKAATSPFALMGALFGGGEELSYLDFDPGSSVLGEPGTKKLDTLIKALNDRPALKLEIEGHVDTEKDKEGVRQYLFHKKIKAQKLKEMLKAGSTAIPVDEVKVEKGEYPKYLKMAYKAEKFPKPRNIIGIAKDLPVPEMEKLMLTHIEVKDDDLRMLASQRALTVKDYILKSKQVEPERVFLVEPKSLQPEKKEKLSDSRVDFRLK